MTRASLLRERMGLRTLGEAAGRITGGRGPRGARRPVTLKMLWVIISGVYKI